MISTNVGGSDPWNIDSASKTAVRCVYLRTDSASDTLLTSHDDERRTDQA